MPHKVSDYKKPAYLTPKIDLFFKLNPDKTEVSAILEVKQNEKQLEQEFCLELNGHESIKLLELYINDKLLSINDYSIEEDGDYQKLVIPMAANLYGKDFILKQKVSINPIANNSNSGLYMSDGGFVTQNESLGFRRIIFSIDRPDNLSIYSTTIEADKVQYPILLSNGNLENDYIELPCNKHSAKYLDPFPKPSYLFALCAGQYNLNEKKYLSFPDKEEKSLQIYAPITEDIENTTFALNILYLMMRWNEEKYEIPLDLRDYKVLGVSVFNMGAMENKGLNVFASNAIFADPLITTDTNYRRILSIVAHETAHNWAGNRVTLRDWSQLSLKEGLATYLETQFSADMLGHEMYKIEEAMDLRLRQFVEDAGSLAHPVHPDEYESISNFYTATIYKKGAALLTTLAQLLGKEIFTKGIKQYFREFDGTGATIEDFICSQEQVSGRDLSQFRHWYKYAGTPELTITDSYDEQNKTYALTIKQFCPATPNQTKTKPPFLIPIKIGLLDDLGKELELKLQGEVNTTSPKTSRSKILELSEYVQTFIFTDVNKKPTPSILRDFTAPVKIVADPLSFAQSIHLISYDTDAFVKWDRMQELAKQEILKQLDNYKAGLEIKINPEFANLYRTIVDNNILPADIKAALLRLPEFDFADPIALHEVKVTIRRNLALQNEAKLKEIYKQLANDKQINDLFSLDAPDIAKKRDLLSCVLNMLCYTNKSEYLDQAVTIATSSTNFTNVLNAYKTYFETQDSKLFLINNKILKDLYAKYKNNNQLLLKWLGLQAKAPAFDALDNFENLVTGKTAGFNYKDPYNCYNLVLPFINYNPRFYDASARGYKIVADLILKLDLEVKNNEVSTSVASALIPKPELDARYADLIYKELKRIQGTAGLSTALKEVINASLASVK